MNAEQILYNMASAVMMKEASGALLAAGLLGPAGAAMSLEDAWHEDKRFKAMEDIERDPSRQGMVKALSPKGVRMAIPHEDFSIMMRERPANVFMRTVPNLAVLAGLTGLGGLAGAGLGTVTGIDPILSGLGGVLTGSAAGGLGVNRYQAHLNQQVLNRAAQRGEEGWKPWHPDRLRPLVTGLGTMMSSPMGGVSG